MDGHDGGIFAHAKLTTSTQGCGRHQVAEDEEVDGHQLSSQDCQLESAGVSCQVGSWSRQPVYEDAVQADVVYSSSLSTLLPLFLPFPFESLPLPLDS